MRRKLIMLTAVLMMTGSMAITSYAAWQQDEVGYWYVFDNGGYARSLIIAIDGVNYAFDQNAYMVKGWYNLNGDWYYFDPETGAQVTGWKNIDNNWYYLDPANSGIMHTSWLNIARKRYYLDENGIMKTGGFSVDGYFYFTESDGSLRRNTSETRNGVTIRYDEDGRQWYKNEENVINGKAGGDSWLPVLEDTALINQRESVKESNQYYIEEMKDELSEDFKKEVCKATGKAGLDRKIAKWTKRANYKLGELLVPQTEIDAYVSLVVAARYGGDTGSWEYKYTETLEDGSTRERTYWYYGNSEDRPSYNYDYDEDYDYDYDEEE